MSKQVIMYDEKTDGVRFAQLSDDTFAVAEKADGTFEPMTYNEWEALRCRQACEKALAKVDALSADGAKKEQVKGFLSTFSDTMQHKYLEGNRSWVNLFDELVEDFSALL